METQKKKKKGSTIAPRAWPTGGNRKQRNIKEKGGLQGYQNSKQVKTPKAEKAHKNRSDQGEGQEQDIKRERPKREGQEDNQGSETPANEEANAKVNEEEDNKGKSKNKVDPVSHQENKEKDKRIYEEVTKSQYDGETNPTSKGPAKQVATQPKRESHQNKESLYGLLWIWLIEKVSLKVQQDLL